MQQHPQEGINIITWPVNKLWKSENTMVFSNH